MKKYVILTLRRGPLYFSSGHFTVFSKTERECLHGHNYYVEAEFEAAESEPGLLCDYGILKEEIKKICKPLHCKFLLPSSSPYLHLKEEGDQLFAKFGQEHIPFLKKDIVILPVSNTSLEDLSQYFLDCLLKNTNFIKQYEFRRIEIKIFNGNEQSATATYLESAE